MEARQQRLWRLTMRARYIGILVLAASTAFAPEELTDERWLATVGVLAVVGPYNLAFDLVLRRRGTLWPIMAFTDQLLAVTFMAAFPEAYGGLLLVMVALNATSAVAFGSRVAASSALVGAVGAAGVVAIESLDWGWYLVFVATSAFVVHIVGTVSETETELRKRHGELLEGIDGIVWEQLTRRPSTLFVTGRAEDVLGYAPEDWAEPGFWRAHVHPEDVDAAARTYRDGIRRGEHRELEYRMIAADGRIVHVQDRMRVETDSAGKPAHVRGVMLDVTEAKEAQARARQYLNLVERTSLAMLVLRIDPDDPETLLVAAANPEAARVLGAGQDELVGQALDDALELPGEAVRSGLLEVAHTERSSRAEDLRFPGVAGGRRVFSLYAFPLPGGSVGVSMDDVTERTMAAEVLRRQALHDPLTGLPNRAMLLERLRSGIEAADRSSSSLALLVMDLNQFKDVNDALGHDHGDRLLMEMSRRLQRVLRDADTIVRLGGDEFAVLLTDDADVDRATKVAATVHESLERPFQLGGIDVQTSVSLGVTVYPDHGGTADQLVQHADVAMYQAKRGGGATCVYDPGSDQSSVRRLALLGELRRAIAEDQLELHFQPSLDLRSGTVGSVEALVRWRHPDHGMVPPIEFVELAEISGLIDELTRWVVTAGVTQAHRWSEAGLAIRVAVNLSVRNLADPELVPWMGELLRRDGVAPALLKLEVTESQLMDDPGVAMDVLAQLRGMGSSTSIDDFGTGYSSLAYLKHLPVDELKIDRSFVAAMLEGRSDEVIVRSTIDLAHNLGLEVVAEGVEDGATLRRLAELGCDRAQGYFIARPMPGEDCTAWLSSPTSLTEVRASLPAGADGPVVRAVPHH